MEDFLAKFKEFFENIINLINNMIASISGLVKEYQ